MPMPKLSPNIYQIENLKIEHTINDNSEKYWTVTDKDSNILYQHQDRDCAFAFAQQHNKMLKAQKEKELQNA